VTYLVCGAEVDDALGGETGLNLGENLMVKLNYFSPDIVEYYNIDFFS
jgi:hypothetical protein